jgi:hypothetical protein
VLGGASYCVPQQPELAMRIVFFRDRRRGHPWLFVLAGFMAAGAFAGGSIAAGVALVAFMVWLVFRP